MNYLAHLALAQPEAGLMLGGFMGDFIKGPVPLSLQDDVARGVRLHRALDAFSDRHPVLVDLRASLPPQWWRFAGILLDMMTDHDLALHWEYRYPSSLNHFAGQSHRLLLSRADALPDSARVTLERLCRYRWLESYASLDFTLQAIAGIGQRMRFDNPLQESRHLVQEHYADFLACSSQLYADSQRYVAEWCEQHPPTRD